jgi:hypothetical protein
MDYQFVPEGFKAPFQVKHNKFTVRKLTVDEVEKDYEAVMSSRESLRQVFCVNDDWPSDDMTIEENREDLLEHQEEFDKNIGFAYTVVTPDDSRCIGCLYIYPFGLGVYDCRIFYWLVDDIADQLDAEFRGFLDKWIPDSFGFKNPVFPGRDMSHQEWDETVKELRKRGEAL